MIFRTMFLAFVLVSGAAHAQTPEKTDAILQAWRDWVANEGVSQSVISVGHQGEILVSEGKGRSPKAAYPIASLTKAVTAVCLHRVMGEQGLDLSVPLGALQDAFSRVGITLPAGFRDLELGSLITMSSGMKPDRTQGQFNGSYRYGDTRNIGFSRRALRQGGLAGAPGAYFYNNGNYAILGALLEALTGTDNVSACVPRVFPEGHRDSVAFDSDWIALAGFGGLKASTVDYTAFVMSAFGPEGEIAQNLSALPKYTAPNGWFYGLGTFYRKRWPQNVYWHNGALCDVKGEDQGAYFAYYPSGYAVTVAYNRCGQGEIYQNLDAALFNAAN